MVNSDRILKTILQWSNDIWEIFWSEKDLKFLVNLVGKDSLHYSDWYRISRNCELSEDFIKEFKDKVNWCRISAFQYLSEEFLIEFIKDIEIGDDYTTGLRNNEKIPEEVLKRIINLKKLLESD
jgi:hypothetical protein